MAKKVSSGYDLFISHASADLPFVNELVSELEREDVRVWSDKGRIRLGEDFMVSVQQALESSEYFLLVISPAYLASQWANFEMGVALSRSLSQGQGRIIPLYLKRVPNTALPSSIKQLSGLNAQDSPISEIAHQLAEIIKQPKRLKRAS
jgi:hypothetical protein